jgi:hypothetical protein
MDEFNFFKTEENILDGNGPNNASTWKKEVSDKMGKLDEVYEGECVTFLEYFIAQKNRY